MRNKLLLIFVLVSSVGLVFALGCSDDDETTGPDTQSPTAADSTFVTDLFSDDMLTSIFQSLPVSFALLETTGQSAKAGPSIYLEVFQEDEIIINNIIDYEYTVDGWHVFEFSVTLIEHDGLTQDTVDIMGVDSIQVFEADTTVQYYSEQVELDTLKARAHAAWAVRRTSDWGAMHHGLHIVLDSINVDTFFTLNGTVRDTLHGVEDEGTRVCQAEITNHSTIDGLKMSSGLAEDDCPDAGQISVTASIAIECTGTGETWLDSLHVEGSWTVTATINDNDTITITFTNGIVSWSVTQPCTSGETFRPIGRALRQ